VCHAERLQAMALEWNTCLEVQFVTCLQGNHQVLTLTADSMSIAFFTNKGVPSASLKEETPLTYISLDSLTLTFLTDSLRALAAGCLYSFSCSKGSSFICVKKKGETPNLE